MADKHLPSSKRLEPVARGWTEKRWLLLEALVSKGLTNGKKQLNYQHSKQESAKNIISICLNLEFILGGNAS